MTPPHFLLWLGLSVALAVAGGAQAAPPEGVSADGPTADWFHGLVRDDGIECCANSDCRPAEHGELIDHGDELDIRINGELRSVPESAIVRRPDNPLGKSIVCRTRTEQSTLYCVIPYTGL